MQQLTVRGFGPELERELRELAARKRVSLSEAAIHLMRRGAGLDPELEQRDTIGRSLDRFFGTWTDEEESELLASIELCDRLDA